MTFTQNLRGRLPTERRELLKGRRLTMNIDICHRLIFPPVALPGVPDIRVADLSFVGLLVQEVEHVFDSQWESRASVGGAKHCLKQVIHKLLQCPLVAGGPKYRIHFNSHNLIDNEYSK